MQTTMFLTNKSSMTKAMNYVLRITKQEMYQILATTSSNTRCVITSNYNTGSGQTTKI